MTKVHLVLREIVVRQEHQDLQVHLEIEELLEIMVLLEVPARMVHQGPLELLEQLVIRAQLEDQVVQGREVQLDQQDQEGLQGNQERLEFRAQLAWLVIGDNQVLQVWQVTEVPPDQQVNQDHLGHLGKQVTQETQVRLDLQDNLDQKDHLVRLELLVLQVDRVLLVQLDKMDHQDKLDPQVQLVQQGPVVCRVQLDLQDQADKLEVMAHQEFKDPEVPMDREEILVRQVRQARRVSLGLWVYQVILDRLDLLGLQVNLDLLGQQDLLAIKDLLAHQDQKEV